MARSSTPHMPPRPVGAGHAREKIGKTRQISSKIIEKDELMPLVDDLESQLVASRTVAHNLLAALVRQLTANP